MSNSSPAVENTVVGELISLEPFSMRIFQPLERGQLVRHTDGGFYRFITPARHTEDESLLYLYEHVWPFDTSTLPWARPAMQWAARFTRASELELAVAMQQDRALAQDAVKRAKAARRAAAKEQPEQEV